MKKFYLSIFTAVFLLTSFVSQSQIYNSIADGNPNGYTLDDPRFWGGTLPGPSILQPPNPCNNCQINIYSSVTVAEDGGSSAGYTGINVQRVNGGSINLYGATTLTVNAFLSLTNVSVTVGNDPTSPESIKINDQIELIGTSSIYLANDQTWVDANSTGAHTFHSPAPYVDYGTTHSSPGVYVVDPSDPTGYTISLSPHGIGSSTDQYMPNSQNYYQINCDPGDPSSSNTCANGYVYGPATTTAVSPYGTIFVGATTLPVKLSQLLALKNDDGSVKIIWATSQEQNAGYYDVERSSNSESGWVKIGSVKAKGYSSTSTNYSFVDKLPLDGTSYYRLHMVDLDGVFVNSKAVTVSTTQNNQPLVVYSNPFNDQIRLKVNVSRAQTLTMTVTDMLGKTYINQAYRAQLGDNLVNLPTPVGGNGMYVLRIQGDTYQQTVKLEKQ